MPASTYEALTLIDALNDEQLFAGLLDAPSWAPWRTFIAALFALPMPPADLETFQHHTGRVRAPTTRFREAALVVGRRGGKSRILALIATYLALIPDHQRYLAIGETPVVGIIAADRKQPA